jgi:putative GTP pyrophosphokinase
MPEIGAVMAVVLSKSQIDRLGDRLRMGSPTEADLRVLDEYRRSFGDAAEHTIRTLRERLKLEPTGRPAKSTSSIIEKLQRESIRLCQMQDIAGCRVTVRDVVVQDQVSQALLGVFENCSIADRRRDPSHGYRAVHSIVQVGGMLVEIQIRTQIEHLWAELSEKLADLVDPGIKYGGGPDDIRGRLAHLSKLVGDYEDIEREIGNETRLSDAPPSLSEIRERLVELLTVFKREYER